MAIKQITPEVAKQLLDNEEDYIYIDVRSEFEFEQGHPQGAFNVPIQQVDMNTRMMRNNPEFPEVMERNFPPDAKLLIGCAVGPRSQAACEILAQMGYQNLHNVYGGFSGQKDMFGNVIWKGWLQLGYPVSSGDGGEKGYEALRTNEPE